MMAFNLQDLLAPTWRERARAEDALRAARLEIDAEEELIWPEVVQAEIRALQPSPEIFLSALVGFWAEVSLQQLRKRLPKAGVALDKTLSQAWASPHAARFPMTPAKPPASANMMRGMWVWKLIEKIGPCGALIEQQLLACLEHPEPVVWSAAETALGTVADWSDAGFAQFLAVAEQRGREGQIWQRARIAAQHVNPTRIDLLLNGLEPGASEQFTLPRFAILERLVGDTAPIAYQHLLSHLSGAWSDDQRAELIQALTTLSRTLGFDPQAVSYVRTLIQHRHVEVQCAAVNFLAAHSPAEHGALLLALPANTHPWVASDLCRGLALHSQIPPELLRMAVSRSLGNYEGYDGEPHNSAVALLTQNEGGHARNALEEIVAWWEAASAESYLDREEITDALALAEALGVAAAPMKPGMERALAFLTTDDDEEEEWPALDQPGAIPEIQERLQASMMEAATPPEVTSAMSEFYTAILKRFSENAPSFQKEIDDAQAALEAEQRELYPELLQAENDASPDEDEPTPANDDEDEGEDELVVRLRAWLNGLDRLSATA